MNDDWQKKEKKEKKKKKEAEASDTGGDAGSGGEESGGGGGGAPKKPVGNVFALFNQGQIQEFKEVWANTIKLHYRHLPPSSPTIIIIFIMSPYYRPPLVAPVAAAAIWCLAALLRLVVQLYCTDIFNLYTLNTIIVCIFYSPHKLSNM